MTRRLVRWHRRRWRGRHHHGSRRGCRCGGGGCGGFAPQEAQQVLAELGSRLVAGRRVLFHGSLDDEGEVAGDVGVDLIDRHGIFGHVLVGDGDGALAGERRLAAEQFVKNHAE